MLAQMQTLSTFIAAGWDFSDTDGDPADWMMPREGEDCGRADMDGSGDVGIGDLAEVANHWLEGCTD